MPTLTKRPMDETRQQNKTLAQPHARHREMAMVPLRLPEGLTVPPGRHGELLRAIWQELGPRFVPGGTLVYAGDTGEKWGYFDQKLFAKLGLKIDSHGKMPDVIIYDRKRNWLILAEAVTSHGPVDAKRHQELSTLFKSAKAGLVFVTVFPDRRIFTKYAELISWETEVWIADNPTHLIHFNGARFLGLLINGANLIIKERGRFRPASPSCLGSR